VVRNAALQCQLQGIEVDWFRNEVVGARTHGRDRGLHTAERGDHDHGHVGSVCHHVFAELDATDATHVDVGHDHVEILGGQQREGRVRAGDTDRIEAALLEADRKQLAHALVVVDD
jgi:hypothetical protein